MEYKRPFIQRIKEIFTGRTELIPLCYGHPDSPELKAGDVLIGMTENDGLDYIAGSLGMNMTTKAGYVVRWRVKEILSYGSVLIQSGSDKSLLDYLKWDDGNRVTCPGTLSYSRIHIRFYKQELKKYTK